MNLQDYKAVAICGFRKKGRYLCESLIKQNVNISYIIERNYEAFEKLYVDIKIPIVGFNENMEFYVQADIIILSGDLPEELIRECLELAGIKLPIITYMGE